MTKIGLTDFLLARIAEDEADAREAYYEGQWWLPEEEAVVAADRDLEPIMLLDRKCDAAHAANWSPARVLAECEAKRRIVDDAVAFDVEDASGISGDFARAAKHAFRDAVSHLASVYADHPDYDPDWRP